MCRIIEDYIIDLWLDVWKICKQLRGHIEEVANKITIMFCGGWSLLFEEIKRLEPLTRRDCASC